MMGGFHTMMLLLGIIGTHFKDAGLQDILIQSGVSAEGSTERAMTGSMYNRSVRMCKLMYEALTRMLITEMERNIESIEEVYRVLPSDWNNESCYHEFVNSDEMKKYIIVFYNYKSKLSQQSSLAAFWITYLDMVTVLLNFIYSFRAGKWHLYLESVRSMLPYRYNYSRYLSLYFVNMMSLELQHPENIRRVPEWKFCGPAIYNQHLWKT